MKIRLLPILAFTSVLGFAQAPYPGYDSQHGPVTTDAYIAPYTGNVHVVTRDLTVVGAVGRHGLRWQRIGNSRATGSTQWFGKGHNWSHYWQWELVDGGRDDQGRAVVAILEPVGMIHRFFESAPGRWKPEAAISQEIVSEGNSFKLLISGGSEVHFTRQRTSEKATFRLVAVLDDSGNRWTFAWQDERLVQVNEPAGRWLKINYATLGTGSTVVIKQVAASDGQVVSYEYDFPSGADYPVLVGVTYPDATHATYSYVVPREGDRHLLERAADPRGSREMRGRAIRYRTESDAAEGQVARVETSDNKGVFDVLSGNSKESRGYNLKLPNGGMIGNVYHPGGQTATETDANGFVRTHEYANGGRGHRVSTTDPFGRVTRFETDANGNVLKTVYPDGSSRSRQYDIRGRVTATTNELGHTRYLTRDERGRVTRIRNADGSAEEMAYNDFGQLMSKKERDGTITVWSYDARGLLIKATDALGAVTSFTHDAQDRVTSITDPRGNTTRYEHDAAGRVIKTIFADGTSSSSVYNEFGQSTKTIDAAGTVRQTNYDELGRQISTIDASGHAIRSEYAPVGESAPWNRPVRMFTASGRITAFTYDAAGRVIAKTTAAGTKDASTRRFAYDASGRLSSVTNPLGKTMQYFYDERGRRIKTMSALKHATTATYDAAGRKLTETDAKGNTTRWTYDSMGRELTKTDAKGQATQREYDAAGRLVSLRDAKLNTYRFEYDSAGRQTALIFPDGSRETTRYDLAGLRMSFTNRAGIVQTFMHDNRGREISSEWSDGSQKIIKTFDAVGRLTMEDNGVSRLAFTYDVAGRLTSETQDLSPVVTNGVSDPAARTVTYTYNVDWQRDSLGYPDGNFIKYTYNARGHLAQILGDGMQPAIASYEYDSAGNAMLIPRENDTATEQEFDAENRTLAVIERVAGHRTPLSESDYVYDEVGNRTATLTSTKVDGETAVGETMDTYHYDETYQVIGADYEAPTRGSQVGKPAETQQFIYDAVGNRIQVDENGKVTRYTVNNLNQYTQVGEFVPTHDRNGNLGGMGQWLYRYDALNRMVSASNGKKTAQFFYDARNRCVARLYQDIGLPPSGRDVQLTLNTYDNWNLIEERDAAGSQQARYVHGRRLDEIIAMVNRHGTFYPHHDALGNVTMLTNKDGRLVERYSYSVTGQLSISDASGKSLAESAVGNRWTFTGREWLAEVGLYDYRNRVYSAELGRFLQTDPIRFNAGDVNIYRYCNNWLLNATDPLGLNVSSVGPSFTGAIVGGGTFGYGMYYDSSAPSFLESVGFYTTYGGSVGSGSMSANVAISDFDTMAGFSGQATTLTAGYGIVSLGISQSGHQQGALGDVAVELLDVSRSTGMTMQVGFGLEDLAGIPNQTIDYTYTNYISIQGIGDVLGSMISAVGEGLTSAASSIGSAIGGFFDWLGE